jgi:hypothetical protein
MLSVLRLRVSALNRRLPNRRLTPLFTPNTSPPSFHSTPRALSDEARGPVKNEPASKEVKKATINSDGLPTAIGQRADQGEKR